MQNLKDKAIKKFLQMSDSEYKFDFEKPDIRSVAKSIGTTKSILLNIIIELIEDKVLVKAPAPYHKFNPEFTKKHLQLS